MRFCTIRREREITPPWSVAKETNSLGPESQRRRDAAGGWMASAHCSQFNRSREELKRAQLGTTQHDGSRGSQPEADALSQGRTEAPMAVSGAHGTDTNP